MGTRRRDAQRRPVSLAVEALEDRYLLSGAVSLSLPAAMNGPSAHFAVAHNSAVNNETRYLSPQQAPNAYLPYASSVPVNPMMVPQRDEDGDNDNPPGMRDGDASHNVALGSALPFSVCNNAAGDLDHALPSRFSQQMTVTAANPIAYLPLLSASGLGAAIVSSLVSPFSPVALSGNTLGNRFPDSGAEPMQPLPQVPDSPPSIHPPTAEGSSEPLEQPSLGGIAQLLPIDVEAIQSSVDAFFQQLGSLSEEWRDGRVLEKLAPWLLAASIAGYGWIQLRSQRRPATQALLADFHCLRSGLIDATSFPRGEKE